MPCAMVAHLSPSVLCPPPPCLQRILVKKPLAPWHAPRRVPHVVCGGSPRLSPGVSFPLFEIGLLTLDGGEFFFVCPFFICRLPTWIHP